ncbi:MAG: hypothetical protein ACYC8V_04205 [Caulobacteraceae bacterium]
MTSAIARARAASYLVVALTAMAGGARAQVDLISAETLHGLADIRMVAADGEASFADGGFGKSRYGGDDRGGYRLRSDLAEAGVEWRPRLTWEWSAVVDAIYQPRRSQVVDLLQAYVVYKPVPRSATSFTARAGLFYPPISLEHDIMLWGITNTITPSALNSWVGEEVKVVGVEAGAARDFAGQRVAITAALFGGDDTAGTLLAYRGWALHDLKSTANGYFDLPPLGPFAQQVQPSETYSTREIDHRLGYYARIDWRPNALLDINLFRYDNRGDKVGVTSDGQWAWATRFTEAGAALRLDEKTRVLTQAVVGRTQFGFETSQGLFADVGFRSVYALLSRDVGRSTLTGRIDLFATSDHAARTGESNAERGWALTAAYRYPISRHADVRLEALHIWSHRPSQALAGLTPTQAQTVLQSSLRLSF